MNRWGVAKGTIPGVIVAAALLWASSAAARGEDASPSQPVLEQFVAGANWGSDYAAALERARAEARPVLLDFTGSDWCRWCERLRDEVFSRKPFIDYAREKLVLVEVDFPSKKRQPDKLKAQNEKLKAQFNVTGYPTVILVDADGTELGRTGYMQGGAKTFVRELKRFAAKATKPTQN